VAADFRILEQHSCKASRLMMLIVLGVCGPFKYPCSWEMQWREILKSCTVVAGIEAVAKPKTSTGQCSRVQQSGKLQKKEAS